MRQLVPSLLLLASGAIKLSAAEMANQNNGPLSGPQVVVTADRQVLDQWRTTASVDVVSSADLHDRGQPLNAWQYPAGLPGVDAYASGGGLDGGIAGVRLRGSAAADTLVLLDGIPVNDPTDAKTAPNLALFDGTGTTSVEVVRGAQSGLYGSGAVGGVIGFQSVRPTAENVVTVRAEGGSYGTARVVGTATGLLAEGVGYALSAGGLHSNGISSQTDRDDGRGTDNERDGVERTSASARVEAYANDHFMLYASGRLANARQEYDEFLAPDDDTLVQRQRTWRAAVGGEAVTDSTSLTFDAARSDVRRGYAPSDDRYVGVSDFLALRATADVLEPVAQRQAFDRATLAVGVDATRNAADIASAFSVYEASDRLVGAYLQGLAGGDFWEASLTGRRDRHSREGQTGTWRAGAALFPSQQLRLHGSVGTAFRAPSLFELYDPTYGNADLAAQRSRSCDLGVGTRVDREFTADVTAFRTDYREGIGYDPLTFVSANTGGYRLEGVESGLGWNPAGDGARLSASWTMQRSDATGDQRVPFLPSQKMLLQPGWDLADWWATVRVEGSGRRSGAGQEMPGYALLGVAAGWHLDRTWELYARGENLLNAAYMLYPGYSTPGASGYGGVMATF